MTGGAAVRALTVVATGPLVLVQDRGRPGYADIGVSPSGAADRGAFELGARLVGNTDADAAFEVLLGGLAVRAETEVTVAVTGAPCPVEVAGRPVGFAAPVHCGAGQVLRLGMAPQGLRSYLTVAGGLDSVRVLGSASTDTLSGLGPAPVEAGDRFVVGPSRQTGAGAVDLAPVAAPASGLVDLEITVGPRADWLDASSSLTGRSWVVGADSDRVGIRLDGPPLAWADHVRGTELASEGIVRGAVQLPPSGRPIIFLADHPTTGGYPVVAVVASACLDRLAQLRPGQSVRLGSGV
ncbi:MAG: biotin-dependent carboxyltransferase family protein [Candidatus Lutibacillus vidarii]